VDGAHERLLSKTQARKERSRQNRVKPETGITQEETINNTAGKRVFSHIYDVAEITFLRWYLVISLFSTLVFSNFNFFYAGI